MSDESSAVLRDPSHQVSPRAIGYWRLQALLAVVAIGVPLLLAAWLIPPLPGWAPLVAIGVVVLLLGWAVAMPGIRYRIHRWEVTETAIYTRSGWLRIDQRIAPLARVQTVDSSQGALMRAFGLRSITVTTASAAGPVTIEGLDAGEATRVVSELTAIVGTFPDDAT